MFKNKKKFNNEKLIIKKLFKMTKKKNKWSTLLNVRSNNNPNNKNNLKPLVLKKYQHLINKKILLLELIIIPCKINILKKKICPNKKRNNLKKIKLLN